MERENHTGIPAQEKPYKFLQEVLQTTHFSRALNTIPERKVAAVRRAIDVACRYYSSQDHTLEQLGDEMGVTRQSVHQVLRQGLVFAWQVAAPEVKSKYGSLEDVLVRKYHRKPKMLREPRRLNSKEEQAVKNVKLIKDLTRAETYEEVQEIFDQASRSCFERAKALSLIVSLRSVTVEAGWHRWLGFDLAARTLQENKVGTGCYSVKLTRNKQEQQRYFFVRKADFEKARVILAQNSYLFEMEFHDV